MKDVFDLVVIGTGTAGSTVASTCREAGWNVAVADARAYGGTCALRGCDPKKVLVGAAEVMDRIHAMRGKGIVPGEVHVDWAELMRFKRSFTEPVPDSTEKRFADAGIAAFHGEVRFSGPQTLRVGEDELEAKHVVIAAGARPATLGIEGEELLTTSEGFLDLDALPERIVFVGGGYVSFELAHVAARAGADVTVLHEGAQALERFDADLTARLVEWSRQLGIKVQLGAAVKAIEKTGDGLRVKAAHEGGESETVADLVVHGAGRAPDLDGLDLPAAGVASETQGVTVNEYLQSRTNEAVYAAGDCAASGNPPLTPVAGWEGSLVAANLLKGNHRKANGRSIPSVVFTLPPLARVGLTETAATEQGLDFRLAKGDMAGWYSSRRIGESCASYKVLVENGTERILGAHLLGAQAEEHINLFALAMRQGLTASEVGEVLYAYPTHGSNTQYMLP